MNGFRHGGRSPEYGSLFGALLNAAPGAILKVTDKCLTLGQKSHPAYMEMIELFTAVERQMVDTPHRF